ncbi:MAG: tRNA pseudouridine(55) synthase TruB [Alphaproteobacteria bacterium]|nr:tRNA pseudouridine(55) synthase TruB [Alphaproteobacteria bacterium]MBL0717834.1 tRNA pseudouridine(55) synthase TruB [Alphaproteobacteria bacterium]
MEGIIVIDKPVGISSQKVGGCIKRVYREVLGQKIAVGHIGTLDPFASGCLVLAIGGASKFIPFIDDDNKVYDCVIKLGRTTSTLDPTVKSVKVGKSSRFHIKSDLLYPSLKIGELLQIPPNFSAIHIDGDRAYKRARRGEEFSISPRKVELREVKILSRLRFYINRVSLRIKTSKGFYVRSLARDFANDLGTVGYLKSLRRLESGRFNLNQSNKKLDKIIDFTKKQTKLRKPEKILQEIVRSIIPIENILVDIPVIDIEANKIGLLLQGKRLLCDNVEIKLKELTPHSIDRSSIPDLKRDGSIYRVQVECGILLLNKTDSYIQLIRYIEIKKEKLCRKKK